MEVFDISRIQPQIERDPRGNAVLCPQLDENGFCNALQKMVTGLMGNPKKQCNPQKYAQADMRTHTCEVKK